MAATFKDLIPDRTKFYVRSNMYPRKMRTHGSDQLKTVLTFFQQEIEQHNLQPSYQKLKTMVKRCMDQKIRARNFEARNERYETGVSAKSRCKGKLVSVDWKQGECFQWKAKGQCSRGNACSSRRDENNR